MKVESVLPDVCVVGESPHYNEDDQTVYFVDVVKKRLHRYNTLSKDHASIQLETEGRVGPFVPIQGQKNHFLFGQGDKVYQLIWHPGQPDHSIKELLTVGPISSQADFNDGKCDARGRLWAGSMGKESQPGVVVPKVGSFFCVSPSAASGGLVAQQKLHPVDISNGLAWSGDGKTLFYIDTLTFSVEAFDCDLDTTNITNRRRIFDFKANKVDGFPDGMTIDSRGHLWVACFGSGQVIEINPGPDAKEDAATFVSAIKFPAKGITSAAFGGPKYDRLYVTCANLGDEPMPGPGSLFCVTDLPGGATGLAAHQFKL